MAKRKLEGKNVLITGGGGRLGAALGREFAFSGANIALLDIDFGAAVVAADRIERNKSIGIEGDVTDPNSCIRALALAEEQLGPIDVLVNNASLSHHNTFEATPPEVLGRVMDVNFWGAVNCARLLLPGIIERRGAVVIISSIAGFAPWPGHSSEAASQHALYGLFGTLRSELRGSGVDIVIAAPSLTDPLNQPIGANADSIDRPQPQASGKTTPEDEAERIVWAVERRKQLVVLGARGKLHRYASVIAPEIYHRTTSQSIPADDD